MQGSGAKPRTTSARAALCALATSCSAQVLVSLSDTSIRRGPLHPSGAGGQKVAPLTLEDVFKLTSTSNDISSRPRKAIQQQLLCTSHP